MPDYQLGAIEGRFADLIWDNEPLSSRTLVELAQQALGWKRSTTYTILRRLSDRGLFQNTDGVITSRISREEFYALQSRAYVEEAFGGSLPRFLAAFSARKKLSGAEIAALQRLLDQQEE